MNVFFRSDGRGVLSVQLSSLIWASTGMLSAVKLEHMELFTEIYFSVLDVR